jgi:Secretion system C-terminal sorting domain/Pregnancy-associated plasma protein-A
MRSIFSLLMLLCCFSQPFFAQETCATPSETLETIRERIGGGLLQTRSGADTTMLYVPMALHLVGTTDGTAFAPADVWVKALCQLNQDFQKSRIQFYLEGGDVRYIKDSEMYNHTTSNIGRDKMLEYKVPNAINCFIVENAKGACGYSYIGANIGVMLSKIDACLRLGHTWSHEMGHFLGLPHTFNGWESVKHDNTKNAPDKVANIVVERADGSNCKNAGDGFCDTPADYINDRWACTSKRDSSNLTMRDPTGKIFRADATLLMGYAEDICQSRFSNEQIETMRRFLTNFSTTYLRNQQVPPVLASSKLQLATPQNGQNVQLDNVKLKWRKVSGATKYWLQVSPLASFSSGLVDNYLVSDTTYTLPKPLNARKYNWRVQPFTNYNFCAEKSETGAFIASDLTSVAEAAWQYNVRLSPNPIAAGEALNVSIEALENQKINVALINMMGQTMQTMNYNVQSGSNLLTFDLRSHLPLGVYYLKLESNKGRLVRSVVVAR